MNTLSEHATVTTENTGRELAPQAPATGLSVITPTAASTITAEDVSLPRLLVGQHTSRAVQSQLVKPGCIYAALSSDDPAPQVLYEHGGKNGVLMYPIGMLKGWKIEGGEDYQEFAFDDPNVPHDASLFYRYHLLAPAVDMELPCQLSLSRSGAQTARNINTILKRGEPNPWWQHAFVLTTTEQQNHKGRYFVAQTIETSADPAHVQRAGELAELIAGRGNESRRVESGHVTPDVPIEPVEPVRQEQGDDVDSLPF